MTDTRASWASRQELANLTYEESRRHLRDLVRLADGAESDDPQLTRDAAARILAALPADRDTAAHQAALIHELTHRPRRHGKSTS